MTTEWRQLSTLLRDLPIAIFPSASRLADIYSCTPACILPPVAEHVASEIGVYTVSVLRDLINECTSIASARPSCIKPNLSAPALGSRAIDASKSDERLRKMDPLKRDLIASWCNARESDRSFIIRHKFPVCRISCRNNLVELIIHIFHVCCTFANYKNI